MYGMLIIGGIINFGAIVSSDGDISDGDIRIDLLKSLFFDISTHIHGGGWGTHGLLDGGLVLLFRRSLFNIFFR